MRKFVQRHQLGAVAHPCFSNRAALQPLWSRAHYEAGQLSPCHWSCREICHFQKFVQGSLRFTLIQDRGQMLFCTDFCSLSNTSGMSAWGPPRQQERVWGRTEAAVSNCLSSCLSSEQERGDPTDLLCKWPGPEFKKLRLYIAILHKN